MVSAIIELITIPMLEALITSASAYAKLKINKDIVNPINTKKHTPCLRLTRNPKYISEYNKLRQSIVMIVAIINNIPLDACIFKNHSKV
jgi:hypothetical protein